MSVVPLPNLSLPDFPDFLGFKVEVRVRVYGAFNFSNSVSGAWFF